MGFLCHTSTDAHLQSVGTNTIQENVTLMPAGNVLVAETMVATPFDGYGSAGTAHWINKVGNVVRGNAIVVAGTVVNEFNR